MTPPTVPHPTANPSGYSAAPSAARAPLVAHAAVRAPLTAPQRAPLVVAPPTRSVNGNAAILDEDNDDDDDDDDGKYFMTS